MTTDVYVCVYNSARLLADIGTVDPGSLADPWLELRLGVFALARFKDVKAAE